MKRIVVLISFLAALGCGGDEKKPPAEDLPPPDKLFDKSKTPLPPAARNDKKNAG